MINETYHKTRNSPQEIRQDFYKIIKLFSNNEKIKAGLLIQKDNMLFEKYMDYGDDLSGSEEFNKNLGTDFWRFFFERVQPNKVSDRACGNRHINMMILPHELFKKIIHYTNNKNNLYNANHADDDYLKTSIRKNQRRLKNYLVNHLVVEIKDNKQIRYMSAPKKNKEDFLVGYNKILNIEKNYQYLKNYYKSTPSYLTEIVDVLNSTINNWLNLNSPNELELYKEDFYKSYFKKAQILHLERIKMIKIMEIEDIELSISLCNK